MRNAPVTVIIAAYRAMGTVADAVRSALADRQVGEVIVVDDASPDETARVAASADDGSGRLSVLRQPINRGPSAARNRALREATRPYVAILDADDLFLPGRLDPLLAVRDWDIIADNIAFVPDVPDLSHLQQIIPKGRAVRRLGLAEFVHRNISRRDQRRGELGFLKPIISRALLNRQGLLYAEDVRLGEDFLLYTEAMARGARFLIAQHCGYVAVERPGSLSGRHATSDLIALARGSRALQPLVPAQSEAFRALKAHARALDVKARHRALLDDKAQIGAMRAIAKLARHPRDVVPVFGAVLADKRAAEYQPPPLRLLFDPADFSLAAQ